MPKLESPETNRKVFLEKSNFFHLDFYNYDKVWFKKWADKVVIICPLHGEFKQAAVNHAKRGQGCLKCGVIKKEIYSKSCKHYITEEAALYSRWKNMKSRCYNPNSTGYSEYGGRGITVHADFLNFECYMDYVKQLPNYSKLKDKNLSIDRINVDKGYEPGNLRWATPFEQSINKRPLKSKSGYKYINHNGSGYSIVIRRGPTIHYFGTHRTIEEAIKIRDQKILELKLEVFEVQ